MARDRHTGPGAARSAHTCVSQAVAPAEPGRRPWTNTPTGGEPVPTSPQVKAQTYDAKYKATRAHWKRRIDAGETVPCWRCDQPIDKHTPWDLGHNGPEVMGPEHRHRTHDCPGNRSEGATRGNQTRGNPPPPGTPSRTW